jgi:integrase
MFNLAQKWQLFEGRNPAAAPGMMRAVHRDKYLTAYQTQALMRALDMERDKGAAAVLALLTVTGARRSEIVLATWDNVDLDRGMLTVLRSKNGRPRYIPLSPIAVAILERQATRRLPGNPHVFPSWRRAKKAAGLPDDLRVHDLRHSFASALANAGTPLNEIGTVLGHTQLSTTTRYAHHSPQRLIATATAASNAWNLLPPPPDQKASEADQIREKAPRRLLPFDHHRNP